MKKIILLSLCLTLLFTLATFAGSQTQNIAVEFDTVNITVNNQQINTSNILYNGTTYIPLRATANMLNCTVKWNQNTYTAAITQTDSNEQISELKKRIELLNYMKDFDNYYYWLNEFYEGILNTGGNFWNREFLETVGFYPAMEERYNTVSIFLNFLADEKENISFLCNDIIEETKINELYSLLYPPYEKINYLYSIINNFKNSTGYISNDEEIISINMQLLTMNSKIKLLINEIEDILYTI